MEDHILVLVHGLSEWLLPAQAPACRTETAAVQACHDPAALVEAP